MENKGIWEITLEQNMTLEQQIDNAVAALKILTAQSAKSPEEVQSNWDKLDSIGYNLKSNISALGGNYSKAALEALISRLYDEKYNGCKIIVWIDWISLSLINHKVGFMDNHLSGH